MTPIIQAKALSTQYRVYQKQKGAFLRRERRIVQALDRVSFSINEGELVGYIGPNGAGKSTTVKLLTGILTPDGGTAHACGFVPWQDRKRYVRNIGVVFGQRTQLWWDVPVIDSFRLLKDIYAVEPPAFNRRVEELTEALELSALLPVPLRQLSLGQRMRAEIAASLLHSPRLLFLDEPTIGLDAVSKLALREFLRRENETHRTTILLTTHDMEDIRALCRRVMVLGRGSLLYDGTLTRLLSRYDTMRAARVRYAQKPDTSRFPPEYQIEHEGDSLRVTCPLDQADADAFVRTLQQAGHIEELTVSHEEIDRLIARMYEEMRL